MSTYVPEIYRRLGTTVSIDLGAATKLGAIETAITSVRDEVHHVEAAVAKDTFDTKQAISSDGDLTRRKVLDVETNLGNRISGVDTIVTRVDVTATSLHKAVTEERALAANRHTELIKLIQSLPSGTGQPDLTADTIPAVRWLIRLSEQLLDKPAATTLTAAWKSAPKSIHDDESVHKRLSEAFQPLPGSGLTLQSKCFWLIHDLIAEVAAKRSPGMVT